MQKFTFVNLSPTRMASASNSFFIHLTFNINGLASFEWTVTVSMFILNTEKIVVLNPLVEV